MTPNLNKAEETFIQNKNHMDKIKDGVIPPDEVVRPKQSIYADFLNKIKDMDNSSLIREIEKEVQRNISTFDLQTATKRITELVWVTRNEW